MKSEKLPPTASRLLEASIELRSIAYLIQTQGRLTDVPLDIEDIHYGLGRLLGRLASKIRRISNELDENQQR